MAAGNDQNVNRVFVARIPADCQEGELRGFFAEFGDITDVEIASGKEGAETTFGWVRFATAAQASAALARNDAEIAEGFAVAVELSPDRVVENPARLFVGNLENDATEDEVSQFFGAVAPVKSVELSRRPFRRFALVEFETEEDAAAAIRAKNGATMRERELVVRVDSRRPLQRRRRRNQAAGPAEGGAGGDNRRNRRNRRTRRPLMEAGRGALFVAGMSDENRTEEWARATFGRFGGVEEVRFPKRGQFLAVKLSEDADVDGAIAALNGADVDGAPLRVEPIQPRERPAANAGAGGGRDDSDREERPARPTRVVRFRGIGQSVLEDDIREALAGMGELTKVRVLNKIEGREQADCTFADLADATAVGAKDTMVIAGVEVQVAQLTRRARQASGNGRSTENRRKPRNRRRSDREREPDPTNVFVGGITREVTRENILDVFGADNVRGVRMRGRFAFVNFHTPEGAQEALSHNGSTIEGNQVTVEQATIPFVFTGRRSRRD